MFCGLVFKSKNTICYRALKYLKKTIEDLIHKALVLNTVEEKERPCLSLMSFFLPSKLTFKMTITNRLKNCNIIINAQLYVLNFAIHTQLEIKFQTVYTTTSTLETKTKKEIH